MHGPDISWYVILSALLFTTGALGVMLRRSPLIILSERRDHAELGEPAPDRVLAPARP